MCKESLYHVIESPPLRKMDTKICFVLLCFHYNFKKTLQYINSYLCPMLVILHDLLLSLSIVVYPRDDLMCFQFLLILPTPSPCEWSTSLHVVGEHLPKCQGSNPLKFILAFDHIWIVFRIHPICSLPLYELWITFKLPLSSLLIFTTSGRHQMFLVVPLYKGGVNRRLGVVTVEWLYVSYTY